MKHIKNIDFLKLGEKLLVAVALFLPFTSYALVAPACPTGVRCSGFGSLTDLITGIINILLGLAFLIAVLFLIIGGFRYIFSNGNEAGAEKGLETVKNALIGIAIIVLSYVLVQIVDRVVSTGGTAGAPV